MGTCNADASSKNLSGDDRKAYMKTCLSAKAAKTNTQQEKMKSCKRGTPPPRGSKGDAPCAFKTYMKTCLSGSSHARTDPNPRPAAGAAIEPPAAVIAAAPPFPGGGPSSQGYRCRDRRGRMKRCAKSSIARFF